jgi:hypothetical protein
MEDEFQAYTDRLNRGDRWKRCLHDQDRARQSDMASSSGLGSSKSQLSSLIKERHNELMERQKGLDEAIATNPKVGAGSLVVVTAEDDVVDEQLWSGVDQDHGDELPGDGDGELIL